MDVKYSPMENPSDYQPDPGYNAMFQRRSSDRVFLSADLLSIICEFVHADILAIYDKLHSQRRRLKSLMLLSKAFFDVIANYLWREIYSLAPLVGLLPGINVVNGVYFLSRKLPGPGSLGRWDVYARRVRIIQITASNTLKPADNIWDSDSDSDDCLYNFVSPQVFAALSRLQERCDNRLLPSLGKLIYKDKITADNMALLEAISSPSLLEVEFSGRNTDSLPGLLKAALRNILQSSPNITKLVFWHMIQDDTDMPWSDIAQLDQLRSLEMHLHYSPANFDSYKHFRQKGEAESKFMLLLYTRRHLKLLVTVTAAKLVKLVGECSDALQWLTLAEPRSVTKLVLEITGSDSRQLDRSSEWQKLAEYLANGLVSLDELRIKSCLQLDIRPIHKIATTLPSLAVLKFDAPGDKAIFTDSVNRGEDFFLTLLMKQGNGKPLRVLRLPNSWCTGLGLAVLQHVSVHATQMKTLQVAVDSSLGCPEVVDHLASLEDQPAPALSTLVINELRTTPFCPEEYRRIPMLLAKLFPNLKTLTVQTQPGDELIKGAWSTIRELMEDYKCLRYLESGTKDQQCGQPADSC
ncbi:hypothetical protein FA15DRAFT_665466 [Coprinopsis marcescibilis]|uniref:Uncharacterized protein n=1 Tax=Coprinopsis marcescibilis TaxID=230819 RepID=A0A5C3L5F6_COPMA|nr:hypothetical protein FA15DRAFT_665466 [Coprinopsis marcescibilis]